MLGPPPHPRHLLQDDFEQFCSDSDAEGKKVSAGDVIHIIIITTTTFRLSSVCNVQTVVFRENLMWLHSSFSHHTLTGAFLGVFPVHKEPYWESSQFTVCQLQLQLLDQAGAE